MCASAAVIPITSFTIALTIILLLIVLVQEYFYNRIPKTFNYISTCASAAVTFTTVFPIHLTTLLRVLVQQYFLQPHSQYI